MKITATRFVESFNEQPTLLSLEAIARMEHTVRDSEFAAESEVPFDEMCATAYGFPVTDRQKPFVFSGGIAFIPVYGLLLHKYPYSWEGATGYDYIRTRFDAALVDPDVKGIVFDVNSPGGQVAGNFELSDHIYANRGKKPMMAIVDVSAYSGGYSLASSVGRIVAAPSGGVGSIGVVLMHVSVARALDKFGVDVNLIYAGKHKVDGSPFKELSDDARARFQASVDRSYDKFVALVARNRGLGTDAVKATEALTYDADDAKRIGLVDAVQHPIEALAAFRSELSGSRNFLGGNAMSDETKPGATEAAPDAKTNSEGNNVEQIDQKARIKAIMSCDEAKERRQLAEHIAFNTELSVEDAKALLAAAPVEKSEAKGNAAFETAMANGNPNMTADEDGADGDKEVSVGDRIAKTYAASRGLQIK